jgi:hypothetical protein
MDAEGQLHNLIETSQLPLGAVQRIVNLVQARDSIRAGLRHGFFARDQNIN